MQVGRLAIHVGSHIQDKHGLTWVFGGEQSADGGSLDALQAPEPEDGGGHHRTGVACGVHRQRFPAFHEIHRHVDAGVAFAPHHRRFLMHFHRGPTGHEVEMTGLDGGLEGFAEIHGLCRCTHAVGLPNEADTQGKPGNGLEASFQDRPRGMVSTHAIHGHPEAFAVVNFDVAISVPTLQASQWVKDQGLQHAACTGHHTARD